MLTAGPQRPVAIAWRLSGHARRLVTLALAGLVITVLTRRAEFAGLAAPALLLLVPRQSGRPATAALELTSGRRTAGRDGLPGTAASPLSGVDRGGDGGQLTEGDVGTVLVRITGAEGCTVRVRLHPAPWISAEPAVAGDDGWHRLPFRVERWGTRPVGSIEVILHDRWRLAQATLTMRGPSVSCYPLPARLDSRIVLAKLPARLGDHRSRAAGEGTEFTGVREYVPGDRQRRINWPATTRRGTLQLNTFTAERSQAVVVVMDVSADVGAPGSSSLDLAVRAATGIAASYLSVRDRVGLISFGQRVRWIGPAAGRRQADRIMNLIVAGSHEGERTDAVSRLPGAALPAGALIVVVSPLLTLRLIETLRELRERGFATIVVDVLTAEPGFGPGPAGGLPWAPGWGRGSLNGGRRMAELATRVWRMEQEAIRFSLRELGIPVVRWDGQVSLDEPLAPYTRRAMVNQA